MFIWEGIMLQVGLFGNQGDAPARKYLGEASLSLRVRLRGH